MGNSVTDHLNKLYMRWFLKLLSAHTSIYYHKQKRKSDRVHQLLDDKNQTFPSNNLSAIKDRIKCANISLIQNLSDVYQQWHLACRCHSSITDNKSGRVH